MSKISDFAKQYKLPLVIPCHTDIEGDGILIAITKNQARVRYDGFEKKYKLPEEIDHFVLVDQYLDRKMRNAYQEYVRWEGSLMLPNETYGVYLKTKDLDIDSDILVKIKQEFPIKQRTISRYKDENKVFSHGLFGIGAGDIDFADERDFVVALAYLSIPGNCSLIADVPPQHYEEFSERFPYAHFGHISNTQRNSCQFTIRFTDATNMPISLANEVMPSDTEKIGEKESVRIIRTAFCYDLIDNRGFVFGNEQDVEAIREKIPNHLKDIFDSYYNEFSKEMDYERD